MEFVKALIKQEIDVVSHITFWLTYIFQLKKYRCYVITCNEFQQMEWRASLLKLERLWFHNGECPKFTFETLKCLI
jgi:hypothetical protein